MRSEAERIEARITVDLEVSGGKPSARRLRMRVVDLLELLASGVSREEIIEDHPYVEAADIYAALSYAASQNSPREMADGAALTDSLALDRICR
jgi:uncharacterized protein (DUF433 family)